MSFEPGKWYTNHKGNFNRSAITADWDAFKSFIKQANHPVFIFWGACGQCNSYRKGILQTSQFDSFMAGEGKNYYYFGQFSEATGTVYKFMGEIGLSATAKYPYCGCYWVKSDGTVTKKNMSRGTSGYSNSDPSKEIAKIKSAFSGYVPPNVKTVSFSANGGSGSISPLTSTDGAAVTLPSSGFTKTNCTLAGWDANGVTLALGSSYTPTANITLAAVWTVSGGGAKQEPTAKPVILQQTYQRNDIQRINVKGTTVAVTESQFPLYHQYPNRRVYDLRMSNNVSAMCLHGSSQNGVERQVVSAYISDSIRSIAPSCFANCTELTSVNACNGIREVGDYAFYNCSKLTSINFLDDNNKEVTYIGDHAFDGSGLKTVACSLKLQASGSGYGQYSFANCRDLSAVKLYGLPTLGYKMFQNCTSLKAVEMVNQHAYVESYCFENCTSLMQFNFPAQIYMMSDHMFEGCANLTSVTFPQNCILGQIGSCVFSGCSRLTSITLPASISSFSQIDETFLSGSNVQRVVFMGMSDSDLGVQGIKPYTIEYDFDKWYHNDAAAVKNIKKIADEKNIPVVCGLGLPFCTICENTTHYTTYDTGEIVKYKKKNRPVVACNAPPMFTNKSDTGIVNTHNADLFVNRGFLFLFGSASGYKVGDGKWVCTSNGQYSTIEDTFGYKGDYRAFVYWKKPDGTKVLFDAKSTSANGYGLWRSAYSKNMSDYNPSTIGEPFITINTGITTLGQSQSVQYVSKTGTTFTCTDTSVTIANQYRVDKTTTSGFRYGTWYYNAKELKAFADANHQPVLVERSSYSCGPCQHFKRNVWNNLDFQEEVKKRKCFFCRVETEEGELWQTPGTQRNFVCYEWGEPKGLIPQLIYYWNKPDGTIYKEVWNYNNYTDPANANAQTVLNKLDAMLGDFAGSDSFDAKIIYTSSNRKYRYYENESGDGIGQHYVCDRKTSVRSYSGSSIDIDMTDPEVIVSMSVTDMPSDCETDDDTESGVTDTSRYDFFQPMSVSTAPLRTAFSSIAVGQVVTIPKYTYQYFTTASDAVFYDEKGVIFKVDDSYQVTVGGETLDIYEENGVWRYEKDSTAVASSALAGKTSQRKIQYIYTFENDAQGEEPDEDPHTHPINTIIECDRNTAETGLQSIIDYSVGTPSKVLVIFKLDGSANSAAFESNVINNYNFKQWYRRCGYLLTSVKSDQWTSGAPKCLAEFEQTVGFENAVTSMPKVLVFHGCFACAISDEENPYGEIYTKKTIPYDSSKPAQYYMDLIDQYAGESE